MAKQYLIIQNSYGKEAGENGRHYVSRKVVNYFVKRYGAMMFIDENPDTIKQKQWGIVTKMLNLMEKILKLMLKQIKIVKNIPPNEEELPPSIKEPLIWDTPLKARHSARVIMDEHNLSWKEKDLLCAVIQAESKFDIKTTNKNNNGTTDWGICMFNDGKNKEGIPYWIGSGAIFKNGQECLENPEKCVKIMIDEYKKGHLYYWVAYKNKSYLKFM